MLYFYQYFTFFKNFFRSVASKRQRCLVTPGYMLYPFYSFFLTHLTKLTFSLISFIFLFPSSFYLSFLNLLLFLYSPFLLFLYNSFDFTTILSSFPFFSHFSFKFILPYPTINIFIINFYFIIHSWDFNFSYS